MNSRSRIFLASRLFPVASRNSFGFGFLFQPIRGRAVIEAVPHLLAREWDTAVDTLEDLEFRSSGTSESRMYKIRLQSSIRFWSFGDRSWKRFRFKNSCSGSFKLNLLAKKVAETWLDAASHRQR